MNISIDIGNTNAKLGFFVNNELVEVKQNVTQRKIAKFINEYRPEYVILGSVKKGVGKSVEKLSKIADIMVLNYSTPVPIKIKYSTPHTLGVDRIAAAVGANFLYSNNNCLVIDMGTCITYDIIDRSGVYHGGGISPGVSMKLRAMHKFTSGLPYVVPKGEPALIGKTTKESMLSGVVNGTIAEVEGIIKRYAQFFDDLTIILCGGDAIFFESKIKGHIFAVPNLVLVGLNQILRFNLND